MEKAKKMAQNIYIHGFITLSESWIYGRYRKKWNDEHKTTNITGWGTIFWECFRITIVSKKT
jgi:hypothetical protein